ncbi:MAG: hypothetical protein LC640_09240 [Frankia sp.]|nr:hypothetical protein [Frankia sp.]
MSLALPPLLRERFRAEGAKRQTRKKFRPADLCRRGKRLAEQQLAFIADPARRKVASCSRRAGKTHACAILLLAFALERPESLALYVTLTRLSGKRIVWRRLLALNREYGLGGVADRGELTVTFPNGSEVRIMGCKDEAEADKLRGIDPSPSLVVIDEAQAFKDYVQDVVESALEPMLIETKGTMVLIGTPGPVRQGYFYEACQSAPAALLEQMNVAPPANDNGGEEEAQEDAAWSVHHWTIADNPFIDDVDDELAKLRRRKKWTADHPTYQREYLGRWVTESDALVYKYDHVRNGYQELPEHGGPEWRCILAVDQGYHDADSIARLWFRPKFPGVWVEEVHHERKASGGDLVAAADRWWQPVKGRCIAVVWDMGGAAEKNAEDARRLGLNIEAAEKGPGSKVAGVEMVNTALLHGCLLTPLDGWAASDAGKVTWDPKARGVKFSDRYHTDIWDAIAYGLRRIIGIVPLDRPAELPEVLTGSELEARRAAAERAKRIAARGKPKNWVKAALGAK